MKDLGLAIWLVISFFRLPLFALVLDGIGVAYRAKT